MTLTSVGRAVRSAAAGWWPTVVGGAASPTKPSMGERPRPDLVEDATSCAAHPGDCLSGGAGEQLPAHISRIRLGIVRCGWSARAAAPQFWDPNGPVRSQRLCLYEREGSQWCGGYRPTACTTCPGPARGRVGSSGVPAQRSRGCSTTTPAVAGLPRLNQDQETLRLPQDTNAELTSACLRIRAHRTTLLGQRQRHGGWRSGSGSSGRRLRCPRQRDPPSGPRSRAPEKPGSGRGRWVRGTGGALGVRAVRSAVPRRASWRARRRLGDLDQASSDHAPHAAAGRR